LVVGMERAPAEAGQPAARVADREDQAVAEAVVVPPHPRAGPRLGVALDDESKRFQLLRRDAALEQPGRRGLVAIGRPAEGEALPARPVDTALAHVPPDGFRALGA